MCSDFSRILLGQGISTDFVTRVSEDVCSVVRTLGEFVNFGWSFTRTLFVRVVFDFMFSFSFLSIFLFMIQIMGLRKHIYSILAALAQI